ncbi:MAG TPA: hypothetical protein VHX63_14385 [Acidobacteriaceae bacterium]|nr:hypothetical protein [Acidobacteriaceae bacterium]
MRFYLLILGVFFVWRLTHLVSKEMGPLELFERLRLLAGKGFWGQLLGCFYCLSLWIAAPCAYFIAHGWKERLLLWPALSGAAILLERLSAERQPWTYGIHLEDREEQHVLW